MMEIEARVFLTGRYAELFTTLMGAFKIEQDQLATDMVLNFLNAAIGDLMTEKLRQELLEERKKQLIKLSASSKRPKAELQERKKLMTFKQFVNHNKKETAH